MLTTGRAPVLVFAAVFYMLAFVNTPPRLGFFCWCGEESVSSACWFPTTKSFETRCEKALFLFPPNDEQRAFSFGATDRLESLLFNLKGQQTL